MRILQVNHADQRGGAAQVAWSLHQSFNSLGIDAKMVVSRKFSDDDKIIVIENEKYKSLLIKSLLIISKSVKSSSLNYPGKIFIANKFAYLAYLPRNINNFLGLEDFYAPGTKKILNVFNQPIDVIHFHNLHKSWLKDQNDYFDLRILPYFTKKIPAVITLHDAWLLSGHCAHSINCERWQIGCGKCPDLGIYPEIRRDSTKFNWKRKSDIFKKSQLHIVTPSKWLLEKVNQSILVDGKVSAQVIPNGVDLSVFHPGIEDRNSLDLPNEAKILLFTAEGARKNKMKDFDTLKEAILKVSESIPNIYFIALGGPGNSENIGKAKIRFIPYQDDPNIVAKYYRAADLYIHAAFADTFPNTIIEALACGKPVVSTNVGGINEQIINEKTGFLTKVKDPKELAEKIILLLRDSELRARMGIEASLDAKDRFCITRQVKEYISLYNKLLRNKND